MTLASNYPRLDTMASGARALVLEPCPLNEFDAVAALWVRVLRLEVLQVAHGEDVRMLRVRAEEGEFYLVADRWFEQIALEPVSPEFTPIVERLCAELANTA